MLDKLFGKKCLRCGDARTKEEFEGIPTCDRCMLKIEAKQEEWLQCPQCSEEMSKIIVRNLILDKCPSCGGIWLERGEVDLLKQALEGGGGSGLATGMFMGMAMGGD